MLSVILTLESLTVYATTSCLDITVCFAIWKIFFLFQLSSSDTSFCLMCLVPVSRLLLYFFRPLGVCFCCWLFCFCVTFCNVFFCSMGWFYYMFIPPLYFSYHSLLSLLPIFAMSELLKPHSYLCLFLALATLFKLQNFKLCCILFPVFFDTPLILKLLTSSLCCVMYWSPLSHLLSSK